MPLTTYNNVPVPSFMYGTAWKKEATTQLVQLAVAAGFTAIDTANQLIHYQEALVGEALLALAQQGVTRDRLFLQTKFTPTNGQDHRTPYDASANLTTQVNQSFDSSLAHLHTDYLDSYVLHGPYQRQGLGAADWEVWAAIEGLYQSGKTKMIGISNVTAEQLTQLCARAAVKPMMVQNRCYAALGMGQRGAGDLSSPWHHLSRIFAVDCQSRSLCRSRRSGHCPTVRGWSCASRLSVCDAGRDAPVDRHHESATYERRSPG